MKTGASNLLKILPFILLLVVWQLMADRGWIRARYMSSPAEIARVSWELAESGILLRHLAASLARIAAGYALAAPLGILFGLVCGLFGPVRCFLEPLLRILRPIPPLAWVPLAILWFGIGNGPSVFVTGISAFFPILTGTVSGVDQVPEAYLEVGRVFGASRWIRVTHIVIPAAVPYIAVGMRLGAAVAWISVVAAEMVSASFGLGYFIESSQEMLRPAWVVVGMFTIGLLGFGMDAGLKWVETRLSGRMGGLG